MCCKIAWFVQGASTKNKQVSGSQSSVVCVCVCVCVCACVCVCGVVCDGVVVSGACSEVLILQGVVVSDAW